MMFKITYDHDDDHNPKHNPFDKNQDLKKWIKFDSYIQYHKITQMYILWQKRLICYSPKC